MHRYFFQAVGILAGTAMGAGVFALPYVFSQVGLFWGFLFLSLFGAVYFVIHYMYGRVLLESPGTHDFFHLADRYLPRGISRIASFIIIAGLLFSLLVYLVLVPSFFELAFGFSSASWRMVAVIAFWVLGSAFMFLGTSGQSWAGFAGMLVMAGIIFIVFGASLGGQIQTPAVLPISPALFFLPFGPILFSLAARSAMPEVVALFREGRKIKKGFSFSLAVFLGSIIPAVVYGIFILGILRLNPAPSPEAVGGLSLSPFLLRLLGGFGLIAIWTSYFVIGRNARDNLKFDLKIPPMIAAAIPLFLPLALYALGFRGFFEVVSLVGGLFLALEGMFVLWIWQRAFPRSRWRAILPLFYLVFLCALGYQVWRLVY